MSSELKSPQPSALRRTTGSHKSSFDEEKASSNVKVISEDGLESEVVIEKAEEVAVQVRVFAFSLLGNKFSLRG